MIVEVDGEAITAGGLVEAAGSRPVGSELNLVVEREDSRQTVAVTSHQLAGVIGHYAAGRTLAATGTIFFDGDVGPV